MFIILSNLGVANSDEYGGGQASSVNGEMGWVSMAANVIVLVTSNGGNCNSAPANCYQLEMWAQHYQVP